MTYDLAKENGQRVKGVKVVCENCDDGQFEALDKDAFYYVGLPAYMIRGGDGYTVSTLYVEHCNLGSSN